MLSLYIYISLITNYINTYLTTKYTYINTNILILNFTIYILQKTQTKTKKILKSFKKLIIKTYTFIKTQIQQNIKKKNKFTIKNQINLLKSSKTINPNYTIKKFNLI